MLFKQTAATKEVERPWQADIDRLQQTLQEVLEAVSRLSGVELPGTTADSQTPDNSHPKLDCKTLKDRIRADLEAFAANTASETARSAERQARVALAAIHDEASGEVEQVTRELREKLQAQFEAQHIEVAIGGQTQDRVAELVQRRTDEFARWAWLMCKGTGIPIPAQIQKLLEPYVEEASSRLTESFRQRFQDQLAEYEQSAQQQLQGVVNSFGEKMNSLEHAAQEISERNADSTSTLSADRLNAAGNEVVQNFEGRIQQQMEGAFAVFQLRLEQATEELQQRLQQGEEEIARKLGHRMEGLESEIAEKIQSELLGHIEQVSANAIESSGEQLRHQAAETLEHSKKELQGFLELQVDKVWARIKELGRSAQESLREEAGRIEGGFRNLEEKIAGLRDKNIAELHDDLARMIAAETESAKDRSRQSSEAQLMEMQRSLHESREKEASQYEAQLRDITDACYSNLVEHIQMEAGKAGVRAAAEVKENSESVLQELSDKVDASAVVLREEEGRASARMESLLKNLLAAYQQQLLQISQSQLGEHRRAVRDSLNDLQSRLEKSAKLFEQEFAAKSEADPSPLPHPPENSETQTSTTAD